jgi:hypothetical protein
MKHYFVTVETVMAYSDAPDVNTPVKSESEAIEQAREDLIIALQNREVFFSVEVE